MQFPTSSLLILAALAIITSASPAVGPPDFTQAGTELEKNTGGDSEVATYLVTEAEFKYWLATTDADITYVGDPITDLSPRSALNTMVTYCSSRTFNVCGGACTVYNGGAACLNAPNTQCLKATNNVGFCDRGRCGGSCNQLSTCGVRLDGGFCATPGTSSILVGAF